MTAQTEVEKAYLVGSVTGPERKVTRGPRSNQVSIDDVAVRQKKLVAR